MSQKKENNISERIKNLNATNEEKDQNKKEEKKPKTNLIQERLKMMAGNDPTKKRS